MRFISNKFSLLVFLFFIVFELKSQSCTNQLNGKIVDSESNITLENVIIQIQETKQKTSSDKNGIFELKNLCKSNYNIVFSLIGFKDQMKNIAINSKDSLLVINMRSESFHLDEVFLQKKHYSNLVNTKIVNSFLDNPSSNFSEITKNISGISSLKTGSNVGKPVVNGLYGNRVTILNNGTPQNGQQWGNDHSPEIDPLISNKIKLLRGVETIQYFGANLGSMILIESEKLSFSRPYTSAVNYFFESNGNGNGLHYNFQKNYKNKLSWKIKTTLKKSGDRNSPNYFLTNTGEKEANIAFQIEKYYLDKWHLEFFGSSFNNEIGVLRGAQIGNITDLKYALKREEPYYTKSDFSYKLEYPKQVVNHHFMKLHFEYIYDPSRFLEFNVSNQLNNREEYDIRRSNLKGVPSLSILQNSFYSEVKYTQKDENSLNFKTGLQHNFVYNVNESNLGILPLIPDYTSNQMGAFGILSNFRKDLDIKLGFRYNIRSQEVKYIDRSIPRKIVEYNKIYQSVGSSFNWKIDLEPFIFVPSIDFMVRNPEINELYSKGLHQGVSGIEEGNKNLGSESSMKYSILNEIRLLDNDFHFSSYWYFQDIDNYIFLKPGNEIRLTIRGAYPTFRYEQTNANIYGVDFFSRYAFEDFNLNLKYSHLKGINTTENIPLIFMPSNNIHASIDYLSEEEIPVFGLNATNFQIEINNEYVFKQKNLNEDQDYLSPPPTYYLLGIKFKSDINLANSVFHFTIKVDNAINTSYRDYLNRQRYFADEIGRNVTFALQYEF